jgi:nitronate monooxygenase
MGGAQRVLHGVLERTKGLVSGVTCGAGMPYKLSEIAASYGVNYLPIISSGRAFRALWKRAYSKAAEWLAAVVYEDPWLAGGHNGLSNAEDPRQPQDALSARQGAARDDARGRHSRQRADRHGRRRLAARRMGGLDRQSRARADRLPVRNPAAADPGKPDPARMEGAADDAGGRRHPAPQIRRPASIRRRSATASYATSRRGERQIAFTKEPIGDHAFELDVGIGRKKNYWVTKGDLQHAREWYAARLHPGDEDPGRYAGVRRSRRRESIIRRDQAECMGCLSQCAFSSWADNEKNTTGRLADPRSFCIQKTLQDIAHGGDVDQNLMFAGHGAYRFKTDPFYSNGFVPTVKQLVDRILTGA